MKKGDRRLAELFGRVAPTYELVNHVLTLGLDIYWRRRASRLAAAGGGSWWVDVGSGTGDMARALAFQASSGTTILALDFCPPMLALARRKKGNAIPLCPLVADASSLPLPDGTVDLITVAFATRNLNHSRSALLDYFREFHRVLRPGGRFLNLETSQPANPFWRKLFHLYVRTMVRPLGALISGYAPAYRYLASTIPRFFPAEELSSLLREAGFGRVEHRSLSGGVAAIHLAIKSD